MGLFDWLFSAKSTSPQTSFTTQGEVLQKYGQGINDTGQVVGMCRPMSNVYLSRILDGADPSTDLQDDKKFLTEAIQEENEELEDQKNGAQDLDHHAFQTHQVPHADEEFSKDQVSSETFGKLLDESEHLLVTYPTRDHLSHEVYLGKSRSDYSCRFFDANVRGGERRGPCAPIIKQFVNAMEEQYTKDSESFHVGRDIKR